jgi:hypothetical protein
LAAGCRQSLHKNTLKGYKVRKKSPKLLIKPFVIFVKFGGMPVPVMVVFSYIFLEYLFKTDFSFKIFFDMKDTFIFKKMANHFSVLYFKFNYSRNTSPFFHLNVCSGMLFLGPGFNCLWSGYWYHYNLLPPEVKERVDR